jgi:hypothetical protein
MNIILWIVTSIMWSLWWAYRKKSSEFSSLPNSLFVLLWPIIWIIFIYILVFIIWINTEIFWNYYVIWLLILAWITDWAWAILEAWIYKKVKISKILPYTSFDKLFIIVIWFILFYWNNWYTSIPTLIITIFTVLLIIWLSIDFKKIKIEKVIIQYIFVKLLYAIATLLMWSVLLYYTTMDVFAVIILVYLSFHISLNLLLKKDFSLILKQKKQFYVYRWISSTIWRWSFILWMFIIQTSWVLIASLLSFITIVFSIISMKFILNDTPTKKQIILAILVIILIWIWYYFK